MRAIFQLTLISFAIDVLADSRFERTTPDRGAILVDANGKSPNSHPNISSAVAALRQTKAAQKIYVGPGYTKDARSYKDNRVTITSNFSRQNLNLTNNDATATMRLWTADVKLYNLNIANTFGRADKGGQALALSAQNTNQGFYGCKFAGYQDTIYANEGHQIYARSYVSGAVDFIFGLRASVWFDRVDIETIGPGFITANGRDAANNTSIYVFNRARVYGRNGLNSTYLGRPWRQWSRVTFQRSYLSEVVKPGGWSFWDAVQPVSHVEYREYKNYGPGAAGVRANFSSRARKSVDAADILGSGFRDETWVDTMYL